MIIHTLFLGLVGQALPISGQDVARPTSPIIVELTAESLVVRPYEAIDLTVTFGNPSGQTAYVPSLILVGGEGRPSALRVVRPDASEVIHATLLLRTGQRENEEEPQRIEAGGNLTVHALVGFDFEARTPLFTDVGEYGLTFLLGDSPSNSIHVICEPTPATDEGGLAAIRKLESISMLDALYAHRLLTWDTFAEARAPIQELAWSNGSQLPALARLSLGRADSWRAHGSQLKASEKLAHLSQARTWLAGVTPGTTSWRQAQEALQEIARLEADLPRSDH